MSAFGQARSVAPAFAPGAGFGVSRTLARWGAVAALTRPVLLPALLAALLLLVWEEGLRLGRVSPLLFAPPAAVWQTLLSAWPTLLAQTVPTLTETTASFLLAAALGIVLGTVLTLSVHVRQALFPHILLFQLIPKVALAPLFIIWLGVGSSSRVSFAVFMAFFPVVVSTMTGLVGADRNALRLCRSLTASEWQTFVSVRVPYALPHIFAGLKIAVTMAIIGVVVGEFVTAQAGLGYIIMFATSAAETALVFAAIAVLCAMGLTVYGTVALAEAIVQRRIGVAVTTSEF